MFDVQSGLLLLVSLVLFAVKAFALVDCITRSEDRFRVVDTLPKRTWLILLGLAVVAHAVMWNPLSLLNLAGVLAAFVYLAQLRGSSS